MLGQFKPVAFEPSGYKRPRRVVPPWLALLLGGMLIGVAAVLLVQERYLPPRLSASASAQLRQSFEQADAQRLRLQGELAQTAQRLEAALAEGRRLGADAAAQRDAAERARRQLAAVVQSLPPDPRGSPVAVRAARFALQQGALAYDVVLSRERAAGAAAAGVMRLIVEGDSSRGTGSTLTLNPVALGGGAHEVLSGSLPLPEGFKPRQTTVHVLDRPDGKLLGMRVLYVN